MPRYSDLLLSQNSDSSTDSGMNLYISPCWTQSSGYKRALPDMEVNGGVPNFHGPTRPAKRNCSQLISSEDYQILLRRMSGIEITFDNLNLLYSRDELRDICLRNGLGRILKSDSMKNDFIKAVLTLINRGRIKIPSISSHHGHSHSQSESPLNSQNSDEILFDFSWVNLETNHELDRNFEQIDHCDYHRGGRRTSSLSDSMDLEDAYDMSASPVSIDDLENHPPMTFIPIKHPSHTSFPSGASTTRLDSKRGIAESGKKGNVSIGSRSISKIVAMNDYDAAPQFDDETYYIDSEEISINLSSSDDE